ncbi:MAG: hypothetical protein ACRC0O_13200, partial [Vibrio metschnikovii]
LNQGSIPCANKEVSIYSQKNWTIPNTNNSCNKTPFNGKTGTFDTPNLRFQGFAVSRFWKLISKFCAEYRALSVD